MIFLDVIFFFAGNNILSVFLCLDVWVWIALNWDDKNIYTSPLSGSGSDENGGVFSVAHHKNMNIITFYTTNVLGNKYFPTIQTQTLHIIYRFGSRIDEQSGGREKDICYRTLILVKDSEVSSMVWCSPSPRTVSLPMVTLDTTTGLPRFLHLLYPRVSPGVSTLLSCTTSQGRVDNIQCCSQILTVICFSMSSMGFNMGTMNSSSIMPSVTSISPTLNTTTPYVSQHTPATTGSSYPTMYKDSMSVYKDSMSVYKDSMSATYPGMSSLSSLRLKAKQHQVAGFGSYSPQPPPLSPRSSCQYGGTPERQALA